MKRFRIRGRRRRAHQTRPDQIPLRAVVPNLITSIAVCGGITSIAISATNYAKSLAGQPITDKDWTFGLLALLAACLCDALDGRVARLLKASSKLGAELDSLADFVNFGVAPALYLYFWVLGGEPALPLRGKQVLLAFALFYAMCDAFRLARFNTMLEQPTEPYWKHFFLGVPAPGGCWMVMTPVLLALTIPSLESTLRTPACAMTMLLLVGLLMASRLPTISLKSIHLTKSYLLPTMAGLLLLVAFLFTHFWLTLGIVGAGYLFTVPFVGIAFLKVRARHMRAQGAAQQADLQAESR
jgi:CDP-diacylglycerol--serine O-phosphatidyltransferase